MVCPHHARKPALSDLSSHPASLPSQISPRGGALRAHWPPPRSPLTAAVSVLQLLTRCRGRAAVAQRTPANPPPTTITSKSAMCTGAFMTAAASTVAAMAPANNNTMADGSRLARSRARIACVTCHLKCLSREHCSCLVFHHRTRMAHALIDYQKRLKLHLSVCSSRSSRRAAGGTVHSIRATRTASIARATATSSRTGAVIWRL